MHNRTMNRIACALFASTALGAVSPAQAASCSVASSGVSFGSYDALDPSPLDTAGDLRVNCDSSTPFTISLGSGAGSGGTRQLRSGTASLDYQLYSDAARMMVWGDDVHGSSVSESGTDLTLSIYGRIPGQQNVPAGSYSDVLTITVSY